MGRQKSPLILANFGGPRSLEEIAPFLRSLLTDKEVIRSGLPQPLHNWIFSRAANKRAIKVAHDYESIGGKSPIYEDTETIAEKLRGELGCKILTFHRYIPSTHPAFKNEARKLIEDEILVFPMFPQFSYATTGSIALWFSNCLPEIASRLRWIKSYPAHPEYIGSFQASIRDFLEKNKLKDEETALLFSAHGLPLKFIEEGDLYKSECQRSFEEIGAAFPKALKKLSFQSKFGPGEWIRPYTDEFCEDVLNWNQGFSNVVFVPLSFTSDHIETLYEVEQLYLPIIRKNGLSAFRCPALNLRPDWIRSIAQIIASEHNFSSNQMLLRRH